MKALNRSGFPGVYSLNFTGVQAAAEVAEEEGS
jgi:hypothetical protein